MTEERQAEEPQAEEPQADGETPFVPSHDDSSAEEEDSNPPSTAAPGKRKRSKYPKTSCELCKARKVKCDRADPACSWCARHNRKCVYLERQRPGSRLVFGAELEAKVNRIDALLHSLGRRVEEHIAHDHHPAHAAQEYQLAPGPSPASTAPSTIFSKNSYPSSSFAEPRKGPAMNDFPPHDIVYAIVDLYFKHCNPWCPILDRKTIFGTFFGSTSINEPDRVLLHAIIATTLRFLNDPRVSPEMRSYHYAVSKQAVHVYTLENVSVASLRALVILSLDELGTSNGPKGWNMLALLTQNARQLGLCGERSVYLSTDAEGVPHARLMAGRPGSWIEDEGRRRLCWMVYLLDRYATVATTSLDFMLQDGEMRRALPCSYDLFSRDVPVETRSWVSPTQPYGTSGYATNKPENLGSFSYHCEILRILSHVHEFLKSPVDISSPADVGSWRSTYQSLNLALDGWLSSLPSDYSKISALCHSDPGSRVANWFMLHGAYVTAVVRLHSSAAYPTVRSHRFLPSYYAMQRCLSAVQSLADITRDVFEASGLDNLGPPFVFSLWVAARLLLVHAAATGSLDEAKVDFFIEILNHVGQYWEIASCYSKILSRAVQRSRLGEMMFAAMRRNAHDLATLRGATRQSSMDLTSEQYVPSSGLDNMDIFDFFNLPKTTSRGYGEDTWSTQVHPGNETRMPDPNNDWLRSLFN